MIDKKQLKQVLDNARLAEHKLLNDLSKKVADGTAGIAEAKQIRKMIEEFEHQSEPEGKKLTSFVISTKRIAIFFDVTPRAIQKWVLESQCPQIKRGWFDLKAVLSWWLENIFENKADENDETIRHFRQQYEKWRSEKVRIEVETTKANLLDRAWVTDILVQQVRAIKAGLEALSNRLSPVMAGKSINEIRQIIDHEVHGLLDNWSRNSQFLPLPIPEVSDGSQDEGNKRSKRDAQSNARTIRKSKNVRTQRGRLRGKKKTTAIH